MTTDQPSMTPTHAPTEGGVIETEAELRKLYKPPGAASIAKTLPRIDEHARRFIELSPFVCVGTTGPDGLGDVTPRGGEPGFVHVLDPTHVAMPDRPGNNRLDSLGNLVRQPGVGLLFFVPGFEDMLRLNGRAQLTTEPALMERFIVNGKLPLLVLVIEVKEVYLHCTKAIRRAGLWKPESRVDRRSFATLGQILRDQIGLEPEASTIDAGLEKNARDHLY
jgi:PPOX class probable FMN-dependent enzyme